MDETIIFTLSTTKLTDSLVKMLDCEVGHITLKSFPDAETYFKINNDVQGKDVIIVETLNNPNQKILPLLLAADTVKQLGAKRVGLVAPYLAYMRQDKQFQKGEGVTSASFAQLLCHYFDWLVTVDPHLHRYHSLEEIYTIPNVVLQAAPTLSKWIATHIANPMLIGPDSESEQWVANIAYDAQVPYFILEKQRFSGTEVAVTPIDINKIGQRTPVIVDDIISTGHTLIKVIQQIIALGLPKPLCMGIHAVFADDAYKALYAAGASQVITANTIAHESNKIDLSAVLADGIRSCY